MGLLRKAASAAPGAQSDLSLQAPFVPSPFETASVPDQGLATGKGLLRRILEDASFAGAPGAFEVPTPRDDTTGPAVLGETIAIDTTAPPEQSAASFEPAVVEAQGAEAPMASSTGVSALLQRDIHALPPNLEIPAGIFSVVKTHLRVSKGCLLLFDPGRQEYAPWASCGYDQTTLRRMRIPLEANKSITAIAGGASIAVSAGEDILAFQRFFSSREFSGLSRIILSPFIIEGRLAGAILITEADSPFDGENDLLSCLGAATKAASPLILTARLQRLDSGAVPAAVALESLSTELAKFVASQSSGRRAFLFALLDPEEHVRQLVSRGESLDPFRLREDLRAILHRFVNDQGAVMPLADGRFVIGLQDCAEGDVDLLSHQLGSFLASLFGGPGVHEGGTQELIRKAKSLPADGGDIQELASYLCS